MVKSKLKGLIKHHYVKLVSGALFLIIFAPIQAQAFNPLTYIGDSILSTYSDYFIRPLSAKIAELFYNPITPLPIIIYKSSKSSVSMPKTLTSSQKTIYVNSNVPNTYITNNYQTTTVYQSSGGGGGGSFDTSSFVSRNYFDNQVNGILTSIETNISTLTDSLAGLVSTQNLIVSGNANIGGDLTVVGNIIGNVVGTINPSFTLGSIPFQGATGLAEDNANFFWNNTTKRLGIGTSSPTTALDLRGDFSIDGSLILPSLVSGATPTSKYLKLATGESIMILRDDPTYYTTGLINGLDIFLGRNAGNLTATGGGNNIGLGDAALNGLTSGYGNIAIGMKSSLVTTSGNYNIAIGLSSLANNTASGIVGVGYQALGANTSGGFNTALGNSALAGNTTGSYNTAVGADAQRNTTTSPTGSFNVSVGGASLRYMTSGGQNTGIGYHVGHSTSSGSNNSYLGYLAGENNTIGSRNIFLGSYAGWYSSAVSDQVFINSIDRGSYGGDQTGSPIYIQQNATVSSQLITFNGNVGINTITPNTFSLEVAGNIGPEATSTRDLGSSSRVWNNVYANNFIGGVTPSGFTQGSVVFAGSGGTLNQDNSGLFYDATNHSLGLGTTSPFSDLGLLRIVGAKSASTFSGGSLTSIRETSTFNTTSSAKTNYALLISNTASRSLGSNALTNVGLYVSTSGAQNNYAAIFDQGNIGMGTTAPAYKLEVVGTFRASANSLIGTNTSSGTATPINLSLGGTYGSNAAGNVGNLKLDLYNDGTGRNGLGISANRMEYQVGTGTVHSFYVGGSLVQNIDANSIQIKSGLYLANTYAQRIGDLLTQNYQANNTTILDNGYYNGTSMTRVRSGYVSGIQMYNGHLMMVAGVSGTGDFTPVYPFKANSVGTVGIGGDAGNIADTFTGNTLVATSTAVGIKNASPGFALHVGSSSIVDGTTLLRLQDTNSTCDFNANTGAPTCGSDLTLKKDVSSLNTADLLIKISALNPVSYRWLTEGSDAPLQNGFIAQEVEAQFPDLVSERTWIDGSTKKFLNMSGMMPYVVGAVKEMDIKIKGLSSLDISNSNSLGSLIKQFLADVGNGIENIFVKKIHTEELCVKKSDGTDVCITGDQLNYLINGTTPPPNSGSGTGDSSGGSGNTGGDTSGGANGTDGTGDTSGTTGGSSDGETPPGDNTPPSEPQP